MSMAWLKLNVMNFLSSNYAVKLNQDTGSVTKKATADYRELIMLNNMQPSRDYRVSLGLHPSLGSPQAAAGRLSPLKSERGTVTSFGELYYFLDFPNGMSQDQYFGRRFKAQAIRTRHGRTMPSGSKL